MLAPIVRKECLRDKPSAARGKAELPTLARLDRAACVVAPRPRKAACAGASAKLCSDPNARENRPRGASNAPLLHARALGGETADRGRASADVAPQKARAFGNIISD